MKEIQLTQGQVAIVDDWWYEELNRHRWSARWSKHTQSYYAVRQSKSIMGKQKTILMHAVIARTPKGMRTDHKNHDTLCNLESNLRVCTVSQNGMNSKKQSNNTSGYKGVSRHGNGWRAIIIVSGQRINIGTYKTPKDAATAYDRVAKERCGEFAFLNFE